MKRRTASEGYEVKPQDEIASLDKLARVQNTLRDVYAIAIRIGAATALARAVVEFCQPRLQARLIRFSTQDVENLVRFGGLKPERRDVIQIDPPPAYGIVQYARTIAMLERHGWPRSALFPHGGNQMSLAIAAGFGLGGAESYPGVFGAFGGFADDAEVKDGCLSLSDRPGIGFEGQSALYRIMRDLAA